MEYALVLLWFVAFQALAFVALPLAARLFPRFPDRGASFALPVALVVVTLVGYWVGHLGFGRWTAFLAVGVLAVLSGLVVWSDRSLRPDGVTASDESSLRIRPRAYAETITVFAVAFGLLVAVRAVDPSVHPGGGEKFLDFGILQSLLRAEVLPPQDMWWAGEHLLYYYGGHLASALLAQLTGTEAEFAYNLALSGFYAALVTGAYGLAGAMADARGASRRMGGALGAFFVGFAANLVTAITGLIWLLPDETAQGVANWVAKPISDSTSGGLVSSGLDEFGYWAPSRVIPNTINEFPLFSFLNGDLHAHMVSTPFMLLAAALGYSYYRTTTGALGRRRALAFGVLPLVVGLLGLVNVWSFPTGLGVVWLAVLFAPAQPLSLFPGVGETAEPVADGGESATPEQTPSSVEDLLGSEVRRIAGAFAVTGVVGVLAIAWVAPFVLGILLQSASNRSIAFFPDPASAVGLVLVHGTFLAVFGAYLWPRAREEFDVDLGRAVLLAGALVVLAWVASYPVLVLVVPLLAVGWVLLRTEGAQLRRDDSASNVGYETVLVVAGAGLVTLVEFVYVRDSAAGGRFNTVFKVYMQVWILWATSAGAALGVLVSRVGPGDWRLPVVGVDRAGAMSGVAALLVVSTALYGGIALGGHFTSEHNRIDDPTLDGKAFVEDNHPSEAAAIAWLDDKEGQPHIAAAPGRKVYSWTSPSSSLTGLPAVIGWVNHEGIYRGHDTAKARASEVDTIFTGSWDQRATLLDRYDVEYVYVGPRARDRYGADDLRFGQYPGVERVFTDEGVVVYRVRQSKL